MGSLSPACGGVVFDGNDGIHDWELWYSNGTQTGTYMVQDINPGPLASHPGYFHEQWGQLIFSAETSMLGREPWAIPCTALGIAENQDVTWLEIAPIPATVAAQIALPRWPRSLGSFSDRCRGQGRASFAIPRPIGRDRSRRMECRTLPSVGHEQRSVRCWQAGRDATVSDQPCGKLIPPHPRLRDNFVPRSAIVL
ncbi:MAG: hypothetical protein IPK99_09230 [Flavobacteriales bacterium]|nr:hypothetical protein [Flavobacteriales bacterium]